MKLRSISGGRVSKSQHKQSKAPVVFGVLAIFLAYMLALSFGQTKVDFQTENGSKDVSAAMSNFELNDLSSRTVYNQMVTNGWVAKDLLETIGNQNASMIDNQVATAKLLQGTNTLITYGLGMIAVIGVAILVNLYKSPRPQFTTYAAEGKQAKHPETETRTSAARNLQGKTFSQEEIDVMLEDYVENPHEWAANALTPGQLLAWEKLGKPNLAEWIREGLPTFVDWLELRRFRKLS